MTERNRFTTIQERQEYERAPTIPSIPPVSERVTGSGSAIDKQTHGTRSNLKSLLGVSVFSIAMGIGGTYGLYKYSGLFDKSEKAKVATPAPSISLSAEKPEIDIPEKVQSNKDLAVILKAYGVNASADDFEKLAVKNKLFDALQLIPDQYQDTGAGNGPKKLRYKWGSMIPAKITPFKDEEVIVATLIKHDPAAPLLDYRGLRPTAVHTDEQNPMLTYHYYRCVEGNASGVGSIVIKDVKYPDRNTMLYGLQMPKCKPKEDPNMPQ